MFHVFAVLLPWSWYIGPGCLLAPKFIFMLDFILCGWVVNLQVSYYVKTLHSGPQALVTVLLGFSVTITPWAALCSWRKLHYTTHAKHKMMVIIFSYESQPCVMRSYSTGTVEYNGNWICHAFRSSNNLNVNIISILSKKWQ